MTNDLSRLKAMARARARTLIEELTIDCPPVDVKLIAASLKIKIKDEELDYDTRGVLVIRDDRAVLGVNNVFHFARSEELQLRYFIGQMIGHFLLHREQKNIFIDKPDNDIDKNWLIQARCFANELLIPTDFLAKYLADQSFDIYDDVQVMKLAARFRVPTNIATIRLVTSGMIIV